MLNEFNLSNKDIEINKEISAKIDDDFKNKYPRYLNCKKELCNNSVFLVKPTIEVHPDQTKCESGYSCNHAFKSERKCKKIALKALGFSLLSPS